MLHPPFKLGIPVQCSFLAKVSIKSIQTIEQINFTDTNRNARMQHFIQKPFLIPV